MEPEPGDYVEIITDKGNFRGVLMPKNKFSEEGILVIKMDNGYNVGFKVKDIKLIRKMERREKAGRKKIPYKEGLPTISFIGTGGTIASYVDYRTGAVHPALTTEDLIFSVPEIEEECNVRSTMLFNILSENMEPDNWIALARKVRDELKVSDGVVIPHGTDTISYTGSALAFMLEKQSGPVVLVGAQRSSDRPSSDAYMNLLSAVSVAKSDLGEVAVVMHATTSDDYCHVHRATRVRKMHTSRRDAFQSVNSPPIGTVRDGKLNLSEEYRKAGEETVLRDRMDEKVALVYYYPGMGEEDLERMLEGKHGAIIMGTGLGHVSTKLFEVLRREIKDGLIVGMTSQCLHGTVNPYVYSTGRELKRMGVVYLGDMLPEVAYVKLMWLLGNYDAEEARKLMPVNLRGELSERRGIAW